MSDESDENSQSKWLFYRDRPEWKDVKPLKQNDGSEPVVAIAYSEKFTDVYDYFRACIKSGEKSERALQLTKDAAYLNPANYTVWQYRRDILDALKKDLYVEMKYIEQVILGNPKNYQVWHHRRVLVEKLKDPSQELDLTADVLSEDEKNYHAWQHRQWVVKTFDLFKGELDFVNYLLDQDIRNNSAWNHRFFVINNSKGFTEDVLTQELEYTTKKVMIASSNESAWNYLRGLLLHDKDGLSRNQFVTQFCEDLYKDGNRSVFLLALIVDMCDEQVSNGGKDPIYTLERAKELCDDLANKYDKVRNRYWEHIASTMERKAAGVSDTNTEICDLTEDPGDAAGASKS